MEKKTKLQNIIKDAIPDIPFLDEIPSSNFKVFLSDLSKILYYKKYSFINYEGIDKDYIDFFIKLQYGGLQLLTNKSLYLTNKVIEKLYELAAEGRNFDKLFKNPEILNNPNNKDFMIKFLNQIGSKIIEELKTEKSEAGKFNRNSIPTVNQKLKEKILNFKFDKEILTLIKNSEFFIMNSCNSLSQNIITNDTIIHNNDLYELLSYENLALKLPHIVDGYFFEKHFSINIYIDISGSMGENRTILAQGIALSLWRRRMTKNIFYFDTKVYKQVEISRKAIEIENEFSPNSPSSQEIRYGNISKFDSAIGVPGGGGTSFPSVHRNIKETKNNSLFNLIITDGEDVAPDYDKKIIYLLIAGACSGLHDKFYENKQVIILNDNNKMEYQLSKFNFAN